MKTPHKHAELIKAWADGAEIERYSTPDNEWVHARIPYWREDYDFRIKPEPKPDLNFYYHVDNETHLPTFPTEPFHLNLKLTFDGETGKLKSAEVIS